MHGVGAPPYKQDHIDSTTLESLGDIAEELLVFSRKMPALDFYIHDAAMEPFYVPGDTVAGYITPLEKAEGRNCIVLFTEQDTYRKTVGRVNIHGETLTISYTNATFPPQVIHIDHIASIAPVIWQRKPEV